ncbi:hypothetical protein [Oceanobacillus sp. CF4.6]|uniref:hypothetical protein n=1 Tax=Oceanobacillus sp. CF4.6 TaxID=3373080 RepID=UPI003EE4B435
MDKDIVSKYITMPMAIKVFKQDSETFSNFKLGNLHQAKLDSVIDNLQRDFNELKKEMHTVHHLNIRYLGKSDDQVGFRVNNEVITFTPGELQMMTSDVMCNYLYGDKATDFERNDRVWED